ncbi:MAG: S41 family peptidase [Pseudomonadota bacterium]|nr:S41 family peptidase [Pseudomonadota bacterium]
MPRSLTTMAIVVFFLVTILNTLSGCSEGTTMARVVGGLSSPFQYTQNPTPEYQRFKKIYFQMVANDSTRIVQLRHFSDAYNRVRAEYVHKVNDEVLIDLAVKGLGEIDGVPGTIPPETAIEAALDTMLSSLDPHSGYMNPQEFKDSQAATSGQFGGLGIEIKMTDGLIEIISPMVDTPAYQAGLKSGDLITHVNGDPIKRMSLGGAVGRLRGTPGSDVRITILRPGFGSFLVTITRAIIKVKPVKWYIEGDIGILQITRFNLRSLEALENAVRSIRLQLGSKVAGLVVDLRNNPGGLLDQSVAITDSFLNKGKIVSVRDREGEVRGFKAKNGDISGGLPIVVLINRGSASASEIVAGALQDHRRATLMGLRSFGKGSVQTIAPLNWDGALRLTTALYYLPSGRTIQGAGIDPDLVLLGKETTEGKREADLPNALMTPGKVKKSASSRQLKVDLCPSAGNKKNDKLLGCAIMFLTSGSPENFIALLNARKNL